MKIGVYNRYWNTCGGGENYTGTIAQVLSHNHDVELISVEPVNWDTLQTRLRLDFSRCSTTRWPNAACERLSPLSAGYDLFINSTYCSSMLPRSPASALICYFPHELEPPPSLRSSVKAIVHQAHSARETLRNALKGGKPVVSLAGHYGREPDARVWHDEIAVLAVVPQNDGTVRLPLWPKAHCGIHRIEHAGRPCRFSTGGEQLQVELPAAGGAHTHALLVIRSHPAPSAPGRPPNDTRVLGFCLDTRRQSWSCQDKAVRTVLATPGPAKRLARYNRIISISHFTSEWITKRWRLPGTELQPPIDTEAFTFDPARSREKIILSVGRFFAGGHNKKHHEMARAFIQMRAEGQIPADWTFVMAGALHKEHAIHHTYFKELQALCAGHPIELKPDLPFPDLVQLYRTATVYWHAAGWGEDENAFPERLEHFGMTTCEAMASGCVPVVIRAAGQKEIVQHGENGFLFHDQASLAEHMRWLTQSADHNALANLRQAARQSVQKYARATFANRVKDAFRDLAY